MGNTKHMHLHLLAALILLFFSTVSVEAGEPWGWPPESGNDVNPEPAGGPRVADTTFVPYPDIGLDGVSSQNGNSPVVLGDLPPQERPTVEYGETPWTLWLDLLMQMLD
jgi:hypothetical protein